MKVTVDIEHLGNTYWQALPQVSVVQPVIADSTEQAIEDVKTAFVANWNTRTGESRTAADFTFNVVATPD